MRLEPRAGRADRPLEGGLVHLRRAGRSPASRATRSRPPRSPPGKRVFSRSLQVPPPARAPLLLRPLRELPDDRRRRPERPRLHRADPRGRGRRGAERALVARLRLHVAHGQGRRPVHAGRLLLPHVHPAARGLAAVREVPARRRRAREARPARAGTRAATTPSTAGRGCSSSAAARPAARPRSTRRRPAPESCSSTRIARLADLVARRRRGARPGAARSGSGREGSSRSTRARSLYRFRAERIVVATGATEQPLVFPGNDLVGVMLPDGVRRLRARLLDQAGRARGRARRRRRRRSRSRTSSQTLGIEVVKVVDLREARPRELVARGGKGRVRRLVLDGEEIGCDLARRVGRPAARVLAPRAGGRARRVRRGARRSSSRPSFPTASRPSAASPAKGSPQHRPGAGLPRQGQVLRLHLRGRDDEGHEARDRRGLRLDRAREALHDGDDGPVPGQALPPREHPRLRAGEPDVRGRDRDDDRAAAVDAGRARPARPAAELTPARRGSHPLAPRGGGRDDPVGGRRGSARTPTASIPRTRCAPCTSRSASSTSRRSGSSSSKGPEAVALLERLYPNRFGDMKPGRIRYGVLTSDGGPDHGRRHDRPARRRPLLRHDDLDRRRRA